MTCGQRRAKCTQDVTKDPGAQVGQWTAGATAHEFLRTCQFSMTLAVPQMIKKAIGVDSISVTETQRLTWHGSGGGFTITSEPSLNFPGSQKFVTKGEMSVSNSQGGCQVSCTMFCSASMPWPMQSSVEQAMATEAEKSLHGFLSFCRGLCEEHKAARLPSPPTLPHQPQLQTAAPPPTAPATPMVPASVPETQVAPAQVAPATAVASRPAAAPFAAPQPAQAPLPTREDSLMDVASTVGDMYYDADQSGAMLQQTQQLQEASASGARALGAIVEQLREMNSHLAAIRGVSSSSQGAPSDARHMNGLSSSLSASPRAGRTWMLLLGVTAVSTSATVWYMRGRHRGSI
ncbi:hypothetical protein DUNSADRAFT_5867 [Dunaliella salina]|uniref:Uncharacterized protein n=1 Tax=Dunaliella salina TaxID=3046 RepID=A0ABQ7GPE3_DUNSA|nr:hypothetical protein DUNSADRAFT_5867 [Dunaliella salina]|eukprot:KAF5836481.1 hypothetical protein DUNSADRAFT_5867 [Dunaliella salina]